MLSASGRSPVCLRCQTRWISNGGALAQFPADSAPSVLLGDLVAKPSTLKPLYDAHSRAIAEIRQDKRYSNDYQRELIGKAEADFEGKMNDAISGFANAVEMKKAALHALAAPSVEEKGATATEDAHTA